jgi:Flp pilus assembly protein TadD
MDMWGAFNGRKGALALFLALGLAGCSGGGLNGELTLDRQVENPVFGSLPAEKSLEMAKKYYRDGHFGLAEQSFRKVVAQDRTNAEAWLGLAASYDRLGRFDQARRAYDVVTKLVGNTPTVLNNLGYHYILRGDHANARATLQAAYRADPNNEFIRNNMDLAGGMEAQSGWSPQVKNAYR